MDPDQQRLGELEAQDIPITDEFVDLVNKLAAETLDELRASSASQVAAARAAGASGSRRVKRRTRKAKLRK